MFGDGVGGASDGGDDGREEEEVGDEVSDDAVGRWRELKVGVCAENGAAVLYLILCGYVIYVYISCLLPCCALLLLLLPPLTSFLREFSSAYDGILTIRRWTWKKSITMEAFHHDRLPGLSSNVRISSSTFTLCEEQVDLSGIRSRSSSQSRR